MKQESATFWLKGMATRSKRIANCCKNSVVASDTFYPFIFVPFLFAAQFIKSTPKVLVMYKKRVKE